MGNCPICNQQKIDTFLSDFLLVMPPLAGHKEYCVAGNSNVFSHKVDGGPTREDRLS